MATILHLETASTNCSVSVARDGELVALEEFDAPQYSHAEKLHVFIDNVIRRSGLEPDRLEAVAVGKGPGSYTGLRIGVSAAKGLCFALEIPLISILTLKSMAMQQKGKAFDYIVPALDARRMEVYSAVFDGKGNEVRETRAEIIGENSFLEYADKGKTLIMGSGAVKCESKLQHPNFSFRPAVVPSAREMVQLAHLKFEQGEFEDVAYFEPFYLKDFIATKKG